MSKKTESKTNDKPNDTQLGAEPVMAKPVQAPTLSRAMQIASNVNQALANASANREQIAGVFVLSGTVLSQVKTALTETAL